MRIGSLFSGAGGLDLAVREVFGGEVVWHSELDPAASKVLAHNWPGVPNLGDITQVDWSSVEPVEVLGGGFPCQDVSAAGKRAGIKAGTRSGLWALFADAIDALRPPIVVIENVRGLLSAEAHRDLEPRDTTMGDGPGRPVLRAAGAVLGDLADLGYDAQWCTVAAASIGAPHRRERVFILATSADAALTKRRGAQHQLLGAPLGSAAEPRERIGALAGSYGHATDTAGNGRHSWRPEPARIVGRPDAALSSDGPVDLLPGVARAYANGDLLPTPRRSDGDGGPNPLHRAERMDDVETRIMRLLPTPNAQDGNGGGRFNSDGHQSTLPGEARLLPTPQWGKYQPAIERWESLTRSAPSPTEPNKNGNPRLSAAFSEWLMGWPAGWVTLVPGISRNDQLRIVGNGVVPQQAVAALRWLLSVRAVTA